MNIYLESIKKIFGSTLAVTDFSAEFEDGKLVSVLGPSGCGKTTILNIIAGIVSPSEGRVFFNGKEVSGSAFLNYNIGYVFQDFSLYPNMTAFENIQFPLTNIKTKYSKRKRKFEIKERVKKISEMLKIEEFLSHYPDELSGGQQQRVAIGRALIREPDILLMDEAFANLDKKLATELRDEIRSIQLQLGITTVFVTHNQNDARSISDKIILMNEGVIQQVGTAAELYKTPNNLFVADFTGEYGLNIFNKSNVGLFKDSEYVKFFCTDNVYYIGFRPENVKISCDENCFKEKLKVTAVIDSGFFYTITAYKSECFIRVHTDKDVGLGTEIGLTINPDGVLRFDKNGNVVCNI